MKKMMAGRIITWIGAGSFAVGIRYGIAVNPLAEILQYAMAGLLFSIGMNLIVKGGKEAC